MDTNEIKEEIQAVIITIENLKQKIAETNDPLEKRRLQRQPKEKQYLQLWLLDQLDGKIVSTNLCG